MDVEQILCAASGWLDLGMAGDALLELQALSAREHTRQRTLRLKLAAQMQLRMWNAASDSARLLCLKDPADADYFLQAAFCLHETGDTQAACDLLLRGPKSLFEMAEFHYNMGCYLWNLGQPERARSHLGQALQMDQSLRKFALTDSDLADFGPLP